jgi:Fur family ferric uptake transcriptional regulator
MPGPTSAAVDEILGELRAQGGRITSGRRAVVEILLASGDQHMNAERLVEAVRARLPDVAESTIYRTLTALEELGVVTHVHLGHGPASFHLNDLSHRHLVCRECGVVIDLPFGAFRDFAEAVELQYGFRLQDEHFAFSGLCRGCAELLPAEADGPAP